MPPVLTKGPRILAQSFSSQTITIFLEERPTSTTRTGVENLKGRHSYTTTSVIYAITCTHCQTRYVGETGRNLADSFGEHLRSVEGYHKYPRYQNGVFPATEHFSPGSHNSIHDMSVSVVKQVVGAAAKRRREKTRVIFCHKTLAPDGMNIEHFKC